MDKFAALLRIKQEKDGGFEIYSESDRLYSTALILLILNSLESTKELSIIKQRAAAFLLSKKDLYWIFTGNIKKNFLVLTALMEYDDKILNGDALGKILSLLTAVEEKVGGPYHMSLDNKKIDLATNVQIAYFLSCFNVSLPNLDSIIEKAIIYKDYSSFFYLSPYPIIYILSRFYNGDKKNEIVDFIKKARTANEWGGGINKMFAIMALKNFNAIEEELKSEINVLKKKIFNNKEINILELSLFFELLNKKKELKSSHDRDMPGEDKIIEKIFKLADNRFKNLEGELKDFARQEIENTISKNTDRQMSLMAYFMKKAFGKKGDIFSDDFVAELGMSNIFFWNAFIIYDDFWDEEGAPKILPTANLYAREFTKYYNLILPKEAGLQRFFDNMMDRLDAANTWETVHCRAQVVKNKIVIPKYLPDYGDYEIAYEPASAHILGPLVMMLKLGHNLDSGEVRSLTNYFRNYLIAMQINDDAHDWEDDLRRGHLSTVVVELIKDYLEAHSDCETIDMKNDLAELKNIYWFKTIKRMCEIALEHTRKSRLALMAMSSIENPTSLNRLIASAESVAREALDEQAKTVDFLGSFDCGKVQENVKIKK